MSDDADFDALLDDFINQQLAEIDEQQAIVEEDISNSKKASDAELDELIPTTYDEEAEDTEDTDDINLSSYAIEDERVAKLAQEEKQFYNSYSEFVESVGKCASSHEVAMPKMSFSIDEIIPRFSPRRVDNIKADILACWDVLLQTEADYLRQLPVNPTDEQILNFAEKISAPNLQLSLISYVETLIEIEACETAYNLRRVKYQKHKIEKELYEEQQRIIAKKRAFVEAIREKNFPIDPDRLVNNFFKASAKDPENAAKLLEHNPAIFAPIQVDKLPDKFFGLVKAKPSDGKIVNKKIGKFLSGLKV